ncbi:hypothetical protein HK101_003779 [Irineochytrium annulatum]|nr:hypothetical protein HK101_003779 [Irineochytrium annulatum]
MGGGGGPPAPPPPPRGGGDGPAPPPAPPRTAAAPPKLGGGGNPANLFDEIRKAGTGVLKPKAEREIPPPVESVAGREDDIAKALSDALTKRKGFLNSDSEEDSDDDGEWDDDD